MVAKKKKEEIPIKDTRTMTELLIVDKKALKQVRNGLDKSTGPIKDYVTVVHPLAKETFMTEEVSATPSLVKEIFRSHLRKEITEQEVYEKLVKMNMNPSFLVNQQWLIKIITAYFYGQQFARLLKLIRSF